MTQMFGFNTYLSVESLVKLRKAFPLLWSGNMLFVFLVTYKFRSTGFLCQVAAVKTVTKIIQQTENNIPSLINQMVSQWGGKCHWVAVW